MLGANYFGHAEFGTGDKNEIELPLIKVQLRAGAPARYFALLPGVT